MELIMLLGQMKLILIVISIRSLGIKEI